MTAPDGRDPRRAWQLHGLALAALVVLYVYVFGGLAFAPPRAGFDLSGFAAWISLQILVAYALLTTFFMVWVGRHTWGPVVMHVLLAGGYIVAVVLDDRAAEARRAEVEHRRAEEERRRIWRCHVHVDAPEPGIPCFSTPGAPSDSSCRPIRRATLANR